jgi:hypothetical protein
MDPDVLYERILVLKTRLSAVGEADPELRRELLEQISNELDDLEEWLRKGGFPPRKYEQLRDDEAAPWR